jgi:hypothetical protein
VLTVEADPAGVERRLCEGEIVCPGCREVLRPWGWASARVLRGEGGTRVRLRPRRSYCANCSVTHVLLPVIALLRRADVVSVVGAALVAKAAGAGHRTIAAMLGRPAGTVRGWLRSFARGAGDLREFFSVLLTAVDPDPHPPAATGSPFGDALAVLEAAARAAGRRWPELATVSSWRLAAAVTHGQLIFPSGSRSPINTSRLWAAVM